MKLFTAIFFIGLAPVLAVAQQIHNSTQSATQPMMRESQMMSESRSSSFSSEQRAQPVAGQYNIIQIAPEAIAQPMAGQYRSMQIAPEIRTEPTANNASLIHSTPGVYSFSWQRTKFEDDALNEEDNAIRHFQQEQSLERESEIESQKFATQKIDNRITLQHTDRTSLLDRKEQLEWAKNNEGDTLIYWNSYMRYLHRMDFP